jgi:hypothetical protein
LCCWSSREEKIMKEGEGKFSVLAYGGVEVLLYQMCPK